MFDQAFKVSDLLFHMKLLKDKVNAFESGEKYIQMQEQHRKDVVFLNRRIIEPEKEAARAHAETVDKGCHPLLEYGTKRRCLG